MKRIRDKLEDAFGSELDRQNYEWLDSNHPQIVAIIEQFVFDSDITPDNLGNYLQSVISPNREAFVMACKGTLRHLRAINESTFTS